MSQTWRSLADQRGFTLAELAVVMAVIGLIMAGVLAIQMEGEQAYLFGSSRVETQQNARVALDLMTRELRSAQSITAIPSATDVTFVDENGSTVEYALSGSTLNRTQGGTTTPLIGGVHGLAITYLSDCNTTPATSPAQVRCIKISLVTETEQTAAANSPGDQRATMECTVKLRAYQS